LERALVAWFEGMNTLDDIREGVLNQILGLEGAA
jgi:hypothetical protein